RRMRQREAAGEGVHHRCRIGASEPPDGCAVRAMKIEVFYALGCAACVAQHDELRAAAQSVLKNLEWREGNVVDNVGRAVEFGVLTLPSIVIDGELVFTSMPSVAQLRNALIERNGGRA